jgi:predicted naringenin-chalcone synthase
MSRLVSIGTAVPKHLTPQATILEFMHSAYYSDTASRKLNILFNHSGIDQRYSVLPDFDKKRNRHVFFNGVPSKADVEDKMNVFKQEALPLAVSAIQELFRNMKASPSDLPVTHLITVTCTGLYSPGLDVALIKELDLPNDIFHTAVNFMGCNAAFHALKMADLIVRSNPDANVLIVCVELCTLHFQPKNNPDHLLSNTIFGDGAAAVLVTDDVRAEAEKYEGFKLEGFYSLVLNEGKSLMGWDLAASNFEMTLNAGIPSFIGKEASYIVGKIIQHFSISPESIHEWAIHPGGKRILDTIQNELQLPQHKMKHSYQVLKEYGNMSSPTILFVLNELIKKGAEENKTILSIGFGPGLSIESALLTHAG